MVSWITGCSLLCRLVPVHHSLFQGELVSVCVCARVCVLLVVFLIGGMSAGDHWMRMFVSTVFSFLSIEPGLVWMS